VRARISLSDLKPRLHSLPEHLDWIPYRTTYYKRDWGFCLPHALRQELKPGQYDVCIDSTLAPGHLSYGECLLKGELDDEVLVYAHTCHPSLANDNISGGDWPRAECECRDGVRAARYQDAIDIGERGGGQGHRVRAGGRGVPHRGRVRAPEWVRDRVRATGAEPEPGYDRSGKPAGLTAARVDAPGDDVGILHLGLAVGEEYPATDRAMRRRETPAAPLRIEFRDPGHIVDRKRALLIRHQEREHRGQAREGVGAAEAVRALDVHL